MTVIELLQLAEQNDYSYYHILSANTFPIVSFDELNRFFLNNQHNYMEYRTATNDNNTCRRLWYDTISIDYAADPVHFVVVAYDENDKFISIEEKPINPKRNFVFAGLYFCLEGVKIKAKEAKISSREVFGCFYG